MTQNIIDALQCASICLAVASINRMNGQKILMFVAIALAAISIAVAAANLIP